MEKSKKGILFIFLCNYSNEWQIFELKCYHLHSSLEAVEVFDVLLSQKTSWKKIKLEHNKPGSPPKRLSFKDLLIDQDHEKRTQKWIHVEHTFSTLNFEIHFVLESNYLVSDGEGCFCMEQH